jgi:hypothetical protein
VKRKRAIGEKKQEIRTPAAEKEFNKTNQFCDFLKN